MKFPIIFDNAKKYAPMSCCIYSGEHSTEAPNTYSEEHIIPLGMGGNAALPKASCGRHRDITNSYEQPLMRQMFREMRAKYGIPGKRKRRPKDVPQTGLMSFRGQSGEDEWRQAPIENYPKAFFMPSLDVARILRGLPPSDTIELHGVNLHLADGQMQADLDRAGATGFGHQFDPMVFDKSLGKMAYAFAVGELGLDGFVPLIRDYISTVDGGQFYFVGSENSEIPIKTDSLHYMRLERRSDANGVDAFVVVVRLFSGLMQGAPAYHVVVGRPHGFAMTASKPGAARTSARMQFR